MGIRKEKFSPGEYYHIYNRTVLKIPEFKDEKNAYRLNQIFLLANSTKSTPAFDYLRKDPNASMQKAKEIIKSGEKFVDIISYVIMPDHYHLLLKELRKNGVTDFIRRSNTSIAKYINTKFERSGPLFESRFKSKHIDSNNYLLHLSLYIHLNPLDFLSGKEWRQHELKNWENVRKELLNYPWSSLNFFINKNCSNDTLSGTEIILDQFTSKKEYESFLKSWSLDDLDLMKDYILD